MPYRIAVVASFCGLLLALVRIASLSSGLELIRSEYGSLRGVVVTASATTSGIGDTTKTNALSASTNACPSFGYTKGKWVKQSSSVSPSSASTTSGYTWTPKDPSCALLEPFTPTAFCSALSSRSLLIVGDSMSQQYFMDLARSELGMKKPKRHAHGLPVAFSGTICQGDSVVTFVRDDYLSLDGAWVNLLDEYSVLLLNTGAHPMAPNQHQQHLINLQSYLHQHYQHGNVLYRTTPREHIGCTTQETPNQGDGFFPIGTESNSTDPLYKEHHYDWIHTNNELYRELIPSHQLLDVAPITEQRPDGHSNPPTDCLHYTNVEVFQPWSWLLLNALLLQ